MKSLSSFRLTAVSLTLALAAVGNAWALTPADGDPDIALYIPGSQANDPVFGFMVAGTTVANAICVEDANATGTATTTHIYFHTAGAATAAVNDNYSAIYCLASPSKLSSLGYSLTTTGSYNGAKPTTTGLSAADKNAKVKVWISRRRLGASFVGLNAASQANNPSQWLTFLEKPSTAACTANNGSYSSGGTTYQWNYSCSSVTAKAPTGATGDVTPDVYHGADNVTPGQNDIDYSLFDTRKVIAGHIIGIPVTLKLRNALQFAGIQSGVLPSSLNGLGSCSVGDESAACQPSLTKAQLASLFSGSVVDWSAVQVRVLAASSLSSAGTTVDLPTLIADGVTSGVAGIASPADTTVHICRRENGAGQQVAVLANILQYPCLGDSGPTIQDTGSTTADVVYATSLGAVDNCLKDFNDGTNGYFSTTANPKHNPAPYNDYRDIPNDVPHGNQWALSIQTTERNASRGANYRFIKIDGASPTGEQVYLGHYPLVGEYTLSWKTTFNTSNYGATIGADINRLQNAIAKAGAKPATVAARNTGLSNHSWGQAGYIALSANGLTPPTSWSASNPVSPYERTSGGSPDACAIPTVNAGYSFFELR